MQAIARPRKTAKTKAAAKKFSDAVPAQQVIGELEKHILVDGFKLVFDPQKSRGSRFVDAATGRGERGPEIIHFARAFHGRAGYTISLTSTAPRKTDYFAKFPWPRIAPPILDFSLSPAQRRQEAIEKEKLAEKQIRDVLAQK